jgi:membrane-bound lytic murein transglycosylase D
LNLRILPIVRRRAIIFNPPSRSASADEKVWFNSPGLNPEKRVQCLPWGLITFILFSLSFLTPQFGQQGTEISCYSGRTDFTDNRETVVTGASSAEFLYEYFLGMLDQQTPVDLDFNQEVKFYIDQYLTNRKGDLELFLQRAQLYFPIIEEQLDKYELPLELKYIAVIESGLNPFAKSSSGAVGLWQFLYNTCSLFDLKVDSYIDERRDPYKSTDAACRYLKYLYNTFHDWNLVMASYNGGPRDVRNAIERTGGITDYWQLRPYLSEQARNYVPKFIAFNYLMNYYSLHNVQVKTPEYSFINTDTIHVQYAVSFTQISSIIHISVGELEHLNPIYKKQYIPDLTMPCVLVLPSELVSNYIKSEDKILGYNPPELNYNTMLLLAGSTENRIMVTHTVKPGEYFHKIALTYNCTIENIRAWNKLGDKPLYPGQSLAIWIEK